VTMSEEKRFQALSAPKGVPDYYPPESATFYKVRQTMVEQAHLSGFQHIELPIFEDTALFARGVGESTDVVSKEMYTFADRGDRSVTLRPEGTAGVMRSVIQHNLDRGQLPVKLNYSGPFFRYERPQAGRYRQLQQVGVEAIGVDDPALDAEVIALADRSYRTLGLSGFRLELTSLGDRNCRPAYREKLQEFLFKLDLDEETRRRAEINPLRVLDDKRPEMQEQLADAPMVTANMIYLCNGLGAKNVDGWFEGANPLALRPVLGDMLRLRVPEELAPTTRVVRAFVEDRPVYVIPRTDGTIAIGATSREDNRKGPSVDGVHTLLRDAIRVVPGLEDCEFIEAIVGARPGTPDDLPYLGKVRDGLVISTGYFRHGILLSAFGAKVGAQLGLGTSSGLDISACDPLRHAR